MKHFAAYGLRFFSFTPHCRSALPPVSLSTLKLSPNNRQDFVHEPPLLLRNPPFADQERLSEFDLKLMDIDSEHLGIPDNEYEATVKLPSAEFQRIVKDLSSIGDTVEISVTKDAVKFSTNGDIGSATIMCRQNKTADSDEATEIDITEPVSLTFALRYLNSFAKATPLATHTVLKLSKELPIVVEYRIPQTGHLAFYLAPKIEEDEMAE